MSLVVPGQAPLKLLSPEDRAAWIVRLTKLRLEVRNGVYQGHKYVQTGPMVPLRQAATALGLPRPKGGWRKACRDAGLDAPHYVNEIKAVGYVNSILVSIDGLAHLVAVGS